MDNVFLKLLLQPVVRASTCGLRAKIWPSSEMHARGKYFYGGRKHDAEERSPKFGRLVFFCTLLQQLECLEHARSTQDRSTE